MTNRAQQGKQASIDGFAHEHIVAGILMKKFQNVSLVDLPLSSYDIIIALKKEKSTEEDIIRVQVKTATKSLKFTGGTRGGVDREYKSNVKKYRQSPQTSDVIIGIEPKENNRYDLYIFPTYWIELINQDSISLNKIQFTKNRFDFILFCKNQENLNQIAKVNKLIP
ncbi:MAG: hypothetical protein C6H99_06735 [Epsilonproteobacteria bacterium]|nr:hypothetical protein [Campylobacterota bacterium]NPA64877.1 hypothetical protein [Campylobacterota bacterium]